MQCKDAFILDFELPSQSGSSISEWLSKANVMVTFAFKNEWDWSQKEVAVAVLEITRLGWSVVYGSLSQALLIISVVVKKFKFCKR